MRCVFMVLFFSTLGFAQLNNHSNYFLIEESEWQQLSVDQKQELELVLDNFHSTADDEEKLELLVNHIELFNEEGNQEIGFLYARWVVNYIDEELKTLKDRGACELKLLACRRTVLKVLIVYYFDNIESKSEEIEKVLLELLNHSKYLNDPLALILIQEGLGSYFDYHFETQKAKKYYQQCVELTETLDRELLYDEVLDEMIYVYLGFVNICLREGKLNSAEKFLKAAAHLIERCNDDGLIAQYLGYKGYHFRAKGELSSALKCFYEQVDMNIDFELNCGGNISLVELFIDLNDLESASKYLKKIKSKKYCILELDQLYLLMIEAKLLFKKGDIKESIQLLKEVLRKSKVEALKEQSCYYLGIYYEQIGDNDLALEFYRKSLSISEGEVNEVVTVINCSCAIGKLLIKIGDLEEAKHVLEKGYEIARSTEDFRLLIGVTEQLYEIYKKENNDKKALAFLELHKECSDSLERDKEIGIVFKEKNKYEEKIIALRNQSKIEEKEKKIYSWIIIATCVFILFIISHYISFRRKQKNRLLENKVQIVELTLSDFVFRKKLEFIESKKEAENKIKNRVSQDLHDSVCTSLTVLNLELQNKFNDDMKMITPFIEKLNFINREIRDIAHDLDSDYQEAYLIPVIEELVAVIRNSGANIHVNFFPKVGYESLDNTIKDSLIKITKESLINAVKHGEANTIELDFVLSHDEICYIIEDNGIGFDLDRVSLGLGILNMKDRVNKLGGELNIDSTIGKGTTICVVIPV